MTEINLSVQFDHSAAGSRLGDGKSGSVSQKVPDGSRRIVTKEEEEVAASVGASIGWFGAGVAVLEWKETKFRRFLLGNLHICARISCKILSKHSLQNVAKRIYVVIIIDIHTNHIIRAGFTLEGYFAICLQKRTRVIWREELRRHRTSG